MANTATMGDIREHKLGVMTIRRGMILGALLLVAGLLVAGALMYRIDNTFRIGSDNYDKIIESKDLIADILPPPLTPYEAMVILHDLDFAPPDKVPALRDRVKKLHADFLSRLDYWDQAFLQRGKLKDQKWKNFLIDLRSDGEAFWTITEKEAFDAAASRSANKDDAVARAMLAFHKLESTANAALDVINKDIQVEATRAESGAATGMVQVMVIFSTIFAIIAVLSFLGQKLIVRAITRLSGIMAELAHGHLDVEVPYEARGDEIGVMARALAVFKRQAEQVIASEGEKTQALMGMERQAERVAAHQRENTKVIAEMGEALDHLSSGDLTWKLNKPFSQSLDPLRRHYNETVEALLQTISTVKCGTDGIRTGTAEIATASADLSKRTESQAASLEQTAAAVAHITAKVRETASGALRARNVVQSAKADADRSGEVVNLAIGAMQQIEESSRKITQIIGMIDEIAFQTNLLALNAGVEAARAGDAGRGFAVVASEVRALAQRSAGAAKEIKLILSVSQQAVAEGANLVTQTGESLHAIIDRVALINGVVTEIAENAEQQASGLLQINAAVSEMDKSTQQNAAMVEQTTAATQMLTEQSIELAKLVARFATGTEAAVAQPRQHPVQTMAPRPVVQARSTYSAKAMAEDWSEF